MRSTQYPPMYPLDIKKFNPDDSRYRPSDAEKLSFNSKKLVHEAKMRSIEAKIRSLEVDIRSVDTNDRRGQKQIEQPFECDTCTRRFYRKSTLDSHLLRHWTTQDHACGSCHQKFFGYYRLRVSHSSYIANDELTGISGIFANLLIVRHSIKLKKY